MKNIFENRQQIIDNYKQFPYFARPLVEVDLYNNKLVITFMDKQGDTHKHSHTANVEFSNRRLLVANFEEAVKNFKTALEFLPTQLLFRSLAIIYVKEELLDGFTDVDCATITEAFMHTNKFSKLVICYENKPFVLSMNRQVSIDGYE